MNFRWEGFDPSSTSDSLDAKLKQSFINMKMLEGNFTLEYKCTLFIWR